jgi:DNA polymerase-3 subunit alpha
LREVLLRHPGATSVALTVLVNSSLEADTAPLPNLTVTANDHFVADVEEVLGKGALSLLS